MYDKYQNENSEQTRIFNVAISLMEEIGYEDLSIRQICNKAGISIGKFYTYFKTKQDLLSHYYEEEEKALRKEGSNKFDNMDVKDQIVEFYHWHLTYTASFGVEFVMNYFDPHNESMAVSTRNNYIMDTTDHFLENAILKGYKIPNGKTIHQLSMEFCMITKGVILTWSAEHGSFSLPDVAANLLRDSLNGLLSDNN